MCVCGGGGGCGKVCVREENGQRGGGKWGWRGAFIQFYQHLFQTLISLHYQSRFSGLWNEGRRNKLLSSSTEHSLWMAQTGMSLPLIKSPLLYLKA